MQGKRFGRWIVLCRDKKQRKSNMGIYWICKCNCGLIKSVSGISLRKNQSQSCVCLHKELQCSRQRKRKSMYLEIPIYFFSNVVSCANKRNLKIEITIEDIYNQWIKQDKKCYFTGLSIGFEDEKSEKGRYKHTASLDRLDSNKDYTKENICLVHKDINALKTNFSVESFIKYCKLVAQNFQDNTQLCKN